MKMRAFELLNRGKTSNVQHRTPNAEVREDSHCHSVFGVGCSALDVPLGSWGGRERGADLVSWSRCASKFWRFLLSMNRLPVASSRQSAAGCCSHELRRSAETPRCQ